MSVLSIIKCLLTVRYRLPSENMENILLKEFAFIQKFLYSVSNALLN
jgi:hypothetical protein